MIELNQCNLRIRKLIKNLRDLIIRCYLVSLLEKSRIIQIPNKNLKKSYDDIQDIELLKIEILTKK